ncbi:MAG: adenylyltransferase/cytidyltransferase family protein [Candidatus Bathyarchaeia archaeon]
MNPRPHRGRIVLAAGVFDLLHYGHLRFLEEARKTGGKGAKLIVVVARDKTVEERKGAKPVMPEEQRRILVEALKPVDEAVLGFEDFNIHEVLRIIKPDIVAVGYDQDDIYEEVKRFIVGEELGIRIVRIGRFGDEKLGSSTSIKRRVIEEWRRPLK